MFVSKHEKHTKLLILSDICNKKRYMYILTCVNKSIIREKILILHPIFMIR